MVSLKRRKIIAYFLILICVFFKASIYSDSIVDYLNTLEKMNKAVLVVSSQSNRTQSDVVKKNDFSLAPWSQFKYLCAFWKPSNFNTIQGYQIHYLRFWESIVSVFRIQKIIQIIFPFHNFF